MSDIAEPLYVTSSGAPDGFNFSAPDHSEARLEPMTTQSNHAIWLTMKSGALEIRPAPYTPPRGGEIVIRNKAVAINPADWMTISVGSVFFPWLKYPFILGSDVAGEVVEVGAGVTRFKAGDRVLGHALGSEKSRNNPAEGAFQTYTVISERMASPIPDSMAYERAAALPLGLSTAASALFQKDQLALQLPTSNARPTGKTVLIWGGSTSVGSNAIQLAAAAGYEVITTTSPKNFASAKALGAALVFDYQSPTTHADIVAAFCSRSIAGAFSIGVGSARCCLDIITECRGEKSLVMATPSVSFTGAPSGFRRAMWLTRIMTRMIVSTVSLLIRARLRGIRAKFVWGSSLAENELGQIIYENFLPRALASESYVAAPDPLLAGHGLAAIPTALQIQEHGVSAKKVVVTL